MLFSLLSLDCMKRFTRWVSIDRNTSNLILMCCRAHQLVALQLIPCRHDMETHLNISPDRLRKQEWNLALAPL